MRGIAYSQSGQAAGGGQAGLSISARCPILGAPEGFYAEGTEGPLKEGELDRAAAWGKGIARKAE